MSPDVAIVALVHLPGMTPARLRRLLERWPDPDAAAAAVGAGRAGEALDGLRTADPTELAWRWARALDPTAAAEVLTTRHTRVCWTGHPEYPIEECIPDRPGALLSEGDRPDVFERPRVAVVGTRAASPQGLSDARELGSALARAGVVVVSGLAIGIDGAVHEGALDAGGAVVGVIATGLDVVYPRRHVALHDRVRRQGLLVTEQPYGTGPSRERFPIRNRIIAALGDVTAVVEATITGGARITARAALDYDRHVLAMPGSRRNGAAAGCNDLLRLGEAHPLLEPADVLEALGLTGASRRGPKGGGAPGGTPEERAVHHCLHGEPATADEIAGRTGLRPAEVARAVAGLVRGGAASRAHGLVWPL